VNGTPNVDDRISDADAGVDQLDGGNGFGTGHFGSSVRTQAGCVGQVWARIPEVGGYSSNADRQASKPLIREADNVLAGLGLT
jgi:hypothetical protein